MRYLLICFENEQYWLEINEQLIAMRQIIIDENLEIHISAREDCLAEGKIIIDDLEGTYKEIFKEKFDNQWRLAIKPYYDEWLSVKQKYPIGTNVEEICKYFYPQGAIVEEDIIMSTDELINEFITAVINHGKASEEGRARLANKNFGIIRQVEGELKKFFPVYVKRLELLLEHEEDYVKMWAASDLLPVLTEKAEKVLLDLSAKKWSVFISGNISGIWT